MNKALSIRQPWAWLIAHGYKDVENRSWRTNHRGIFLIHAGKSFDKEGYAWVKANFPGIPLPEPMAFELGGIVGQAKVVSCVEPGSRQLGVCTSPWYFNEYGFLVQEATPLPFRSLTGKLNFFKADDILF